VVRRATVPAVRVVTNARDWVLFAILGTQVVSGIGVAILYPWGSSWYAATATPYLRSLLLFAPDISAMAVMPWLVQVHVITAFVLLGYAPFSRLVHVLVAPMPYLWRKPQIVRWYRGPETVVPFSSRSVR
jgi:nitrate reductase gamma subunit